MCWISSTTNYNLISGHLNNWLTIIFILFCVSFFDSKCLKYKQKKTSTVPLILFFMNLKYIVKKNKKWFWQHIGQIQVLISNKQKILWIKQIKRSEKKVATVNFLNNLDIKNLGGVWKPKDLIHSYLQVFFQLRMVLNFLGMLTAARRWQESQKAWKYKGEERYREDRERRATEKQQILMSISCHP